MVALGQIVRHRTHAVDVGGIVVGGGAPVVVQSMTNTDTADPDSTTSQVVELAKAGSEIVRITVNDDAAAKAVPTLVERLRLLGWSTPIVGDFHFNGHKLLTEYPDMARALAKYRINPGNVGFGKKRDIQFEQMIEAALRYEKPVRIGVNWGSLDQELATGLMDANALRPNPRPADDVMREAMVISALQSAEKAQALGLPADRIILSTKLSRVHDLVCGLQGIGAALELRAPPRADRGGDGTKGVVASAAALSLLLTAGIGDTIRRRSRPGPANPVRARSRPARKCCRHWIFASSRHRWPPARAAARTSSTFQELAQSIQTWLGGRCPAGRRPPRRRGDEGRGDGLHREWSRREQACQYRHFAAWLRRKPVGAGVHRR